MAVQARTHFPTPMVLVAAVAVVSIVRLQFRYQAQSQSLQVLEAPAEVQLHLDPEIMVLEEVHRLSERSLRAVVAVAVAKSQDQMA